MFRKIKIPNSYKPEDISFLASGSLHEGILRTRRIKKDSSYPHQTFTTCSVKEATGKDSTKYGINFSQYKMQAEWIYYQTIEPALFATLQAINRYAFITL